MCVDEVARTLGFSRGNPFGGLHLEVAAAGAHAEIGRDEIGDGGAPSVRDVRVENDARNPYVPPDARGLGGLVAPERERSAGERGKNSERPSQGAVLLPYSPPMKEPGQVDVLVIGAGPVGLACAIEASRQGLSHVLIEKAAPLHTLVRWPTHTVFFSTPELLEIGGHPFVTERGKPTRREGLAYYRKVSEREGLLIRHHETVTSLERRAGLFHVTTSRGVHRARAVVVATGFFDTPNLLGVPGEDRENVSHYYTEPYPHTASDVLVVGGKNSAVEAALDLHRNGARVTMAVRGRAFGASVKYWLKPDIENRVKEGSIRALFETQVVSIEDGLVVLDTAGTKSGIPNDFVFALTGYRPDFPLLRSLGIAITDDLHVVHDPVSMETSVPGLYVAGVVAAGIDIGKLFIENGRLHAVAIVKHILACRGASPSAPLAAPALRTFQDGD